jgi:PAS domain S-box-containing protein
VTAHAGGRLQTAGRPAPPPLPEQTDATRTRTRFQAPARQGDWSHLFASAFRNSRNPMVLLDRSRCHVDFNGAYMRTMGYSRAQMIGRPIYDFVAGAPIATEREWQAALAGGDFGGEAELVTADGSTVAIQFAATTEVVTGRQLVLFVALNTSRWGRRFRSEPTGDQTLKPLSAREREIVMLIALGCTGPEMADELRIAHDTVRTHARNAMAKVGARSRAHLVAKALGQGLVFG